MNRSIWAASAFLLILSALLVFNLKVDHKNDTVSVWMESPPSNTDPIDYDFVSHHIAFRSVYSSVVSQYRVGQFHPVLVSHWDSAREYSEWTLHLKPGLKFDNGDPIRTSDIVNSWLRIAHLMKTRKSESGFFEKLVGHKEWRGWGYDIDGLSFDDNTIHLKFRAPFRKFLETVSFGLYAVVHPDCYESKTGTWKNPKCLIASGPYRIGAWTDDQLNLELRDTASLENGLTKISIRWDPHSREKSDICIGLSLEDSLKSNREFWGTPTANMAYVRCASWSSPSSSCGNAQKRRALRSEFFRHLRQRPDLSFFPLSIPGIEPFKLDSIGLQEQRTSKTPEVRYRLSSILYPPFQAFNEALEALGRSGEAHTKPVVLTSPEARVEYEPNLSHYKVDLMSGYTGILIEAPKDDIRFMFLSKEGIRLPDTDGRITAELNKPDFDPQTINELLWDQAVIWPLAHFAMGFWAKKGLFDFSQINLTLPPTDFQYIRWK